ncbi:MAG: kynureninase [Aquiluna sp.]
MSKAANWTAESVAQLDQEDPLAKFRELFVIADPEICYLDGNSLGRLPKATIDRVNSFLTDEWGKELVDGWSHWIDQAQTAGDLLAKTALGAGPGQTLVCDTTSVNFYQLCVAAIKANPGRKKIIIDSANFPTDRYIVQGIAKQFNLELITLNSDGMGGPGAVEIASEYEEIALAALEPHLTDDVALLTLQAVNYRSGVKQDIKAITDLARKKGIYVVWDCSHAIGSVELNFEQNGVDLAVGCTYKYGNSGPGSPAWLYVRKSLQEKLQVPIQGWFAQDKQFEMGAFFEPTNQIRGFQIASPSIIGIRAVEVAFQMIGEASIEKINQKASQGTQLMVDLYDQWLVDIGFTLATPRDAHKRGGHIIIQHQDAKQIAYALRKLKKVIPDYREPGAIRLGISPLPTSYSEVFEGFKRLKELVESGDYKNVSESSSRVT